MKILLTATFVLALSWPVWAEEPQKIEFTTSSIDSSRLTVGASTSLTIAHEGKEAVIDFSEGIVKYSGDLSVHESARIFFNSVLDYYGQCKDMVALFDNIPVVKGCTEGPEGSFICPQGFQ